MQPVRFLIVWCCLLSVGVAVAQGGTCPTLVQEALSVSTELCVDLERNQACYGSVSVQAEPQPDAADFVFDAVGDIEDISQLHGLAISPMNTTTGEWGVAVMELQANIPDTLPGQNVTFILFGDVEIEDADGSTPMQAFSLRTGIGDAQCDEAPESGMLIQTPDGVQEVTFNINGVDISIGSTVLFQASHDNEMILNVLEGKAIIDHDGHLFTAIAGTRMRMTMDNNLQPTDAPAMPELYDMARMENLPLLLLRRQIDVAPPLEHNVFERMTNRLERGLPPCGGLGLPDCRAFQRFDAEARWAQPENWSTVLQRLCERRAIDARVQCSDSPEQDGLSSQGD